MAVGRNDQALLDEGLARGADEVLTVRDSQGDGIVPDESIATALCEAIRASTPAVVLVGATRTGAELAACAAQMLQIPCASSCVLLEMDDVAIRVSIGGCTVAIRVAAIAQHCAVHGHSSTQAFPSERRRSRESPWEHRELHVQLPRRESRH